MREIGFEPMQALSYCVSPKPARVINDIFVSRELPRLSAARLTTPALPLVKNRIKKNIKTYLLNL